MANENINETFQAGDKVYLTNQNMSAEVIDVREFQGKTTFVVHTEKGKRIVVGQSQMKKLEE